MDFDRLNRWLTLAANIGVFLGIVLLLFELNQNRVVTEAQTRSAITASIIELTGMFSQTPMGMTIYEKMLSNEPLTVQELIWRRGASRSLFRHWENVYFQFRVGLFNEQELDTYRVYWRNVTRCQPWQQEFWDNTKMQFDPFFREELDLILEEAGGCQPPKL
jgi:hypothetical protein